MNPKHPSVDERQALGKGARSQVALNASPRMGAGPDRPDPVALLEDQNAHP